MGATQDMIEKKYPGATAMVAIGCAGDANPSPRGEFGHVSQHAAMITDKIDKLLQADKFTALNNIPVGRMKRVELTFAHVPDAKEFVEQSKLDAADGLYARNSLSILGRRWFNFRHDALPYSGMEFRKSAGHCILRWRSCCGL
jgi:hypothetical protein